MHIPTPSLYLHRLFTWPSHTLPMNKTLKWSSQQKGFEPMERNSKPWVSIEAIDNQPILRVPQGDTSVFLNGRPSKGGQLAPGDWIQIAECHYYVSTSSDHHLATTPFNSKNKNWIKYLKLIPSMGQSREPVLILGESGTGKEGLFNLLHQYSQRKEASKVMVNCGSINASLVESELFGHKKGSFTGALDDRKGAFEAARGGTLFLDEIADLPLSLQPALLRALENKQIKPVGADHAQSTDVRIISATHDNLPSKVREGHFRQDLYFRISVLQINVPPLKDRLEDFESLLSYFCKFQQIAFNVNAKQRLKKHNWPGNIRELKNLVCRAKVLFPGKTITEWDLDELIDNVSIIHPTNTDQNPSHLSTKELDMSLEDIKKGLIIKKLIEYSGNQRKAAQSLGMPKSTLNDKIRRYNIDIPRLVAQFKNEK